MSCICLLSASVLKLTHFIATMHQAPQCDRRESEAQTQASEDCIKQITQMSKGWHPSTPAVAACSVGLCNKWNWDQGSCQSGSKYKTWKSTHVWIQAPLFKAFFFNKMPKWRVENRVRTQIRDRNRQQGTVAEIRRFSTGSNFGKNMQTHLSEALHSDTKEALSGEYLAANNFLQRFHPAWRFWFWLFTKTKLDRGRCHYPVSEIISSLLMIPLSINLISLL